MRKRPLGKTGLEVTELGLGTWGLSGDGYGPVPETEQDKVIERARALGINLFETADSYALGAMERRLGERLGKDEHALFVTKIGTDREAAIPKKRFDREWLGQAVARSAERLGRETLDVVLLHNPSEPAVVRGEATSLLEELREQGKLRAWGVSAGNVEVARAALQKGAQVLSLTFNVLSAGDLLSLAFEIEKSEVGVLAHSVLSFGLLAGQWSAEKVFADNDHRYERWTPDELRLRLRQLDALRPAVGGKVLTLRAVALRYVLDNPKVSSALIGPRSTIQLDQLVREAGKGPPYFEDSVMISLRNRLRMLRVGA